MSITLDETALVILFALFMFNTWINYRLGFKTGLYKGHMYGVKDLVDYMVDEGSIAAQLVDTDTETERCATNTEIAAYMILKLHERREIQAE